MMIQRLQQAFDTAPHGIHDIGSLKTHLNIAIQLEHSTIPPYLCALYSIQDGHNLEAARIIRSVVIEEMLHMALAANVLRALGGKVRLTDSKFPLRYPTELPDSDGSIKVGLGKFSREAIRTFMKIERPAPKDAKPQAHGYHTIAQFYAAIQKGLDEVCKDNKHFKRHPLQAGRKEYYGAYGQLFPIDRPLTALEDAQRALDQIVNQGEGKGSLFTNQRHVEVAHYYRFKEILKERLYGPADKRHSAPSGPKLPVDWDAVYDMHPNPSASHFKRGSEARRKMEEFSRTYMGLLAKIQDSLNDDPQNLGQCVTGMYELKYKAVELMKIPYSMVADSAVPGAPQTGTLGPSFEYVSAAAAA
jgi:hypothetical protein